MAFTASTWGQGRLLTGLSPASSLSGFTAVITKANLPTSALDTGSLSCLNGGGDWRFATDINGANQLPCEIVSCVTNATAGNTEFESWIRFPTYASGTREVYAFWNKAGQSQPLVDAAFGRNAVWTDSHLANHFQNNVVDSTGTATLTNNGVSFVAGKIGQGVKAATASNTIVSDRSYGLGLSDFSFSVWVKTNVTSSRLKYIFGNFAQSGGTGFQGGWVFGIENNKLLFYTQGSAATSVVGTTLLNDNAWHHVVGVRQGTTMSVYVDSVLDGTITGAIRDIFNTSVEAYIRQPNSFWDSYLNDFDEGVLHKSAKSANLIASEYSNQDNTSTFWTGGAVFVPGGGGAITVTESTQSIDWITQNPSIEFTGIISVQESTQAIGFNSENPTIDFTGSITIEESTQAINWATQDPLVTLTPPNTILITESTQTVDWLNQNPIVLFSGTIAVTESTKTINMLTQNPSVDFGTLWTDKPTESTSWTDSVISSTIWTDK